MPWTLIGGTIARPSLPLVLRSVSSVLSISSLRDGITRSACGPSHVVHRGRDLRSPVNTLGKQNERDDRAGRREDDPRRWRLPELTLRLPGEQPAIVKITSRSGKGSSRRESAGLFQCNITKCSCAITSGDGVDAENAPYLMMQGVTWGVASAY